MSRSNDEDENQRRLGRRKFLRIGTLGAAALAAGAAGEAKASPGTETPGDAAQTPPAQGQPAQTPPAPRPASQFKRNLDPRGRIECYGADQHVIGEKRDTRTERDTRGLSNFRRQVKSRVRIPNRRSVGGDPA